MRARRVLLLALLALDTLAAPAAAAPQARIVSGTDASPGEYPAQGYLQVELAPGSSAPAAAPC